MNVIDDLLTTFEKEALDGWPEELQKYFAKNMNAMLKGRGLLEQSLEERISSKISAVTLQSSEPLRVYDYKRAAKEANRSVKTISRNANNGTLRTIEINGRPHVFAEDLEAYVLESNKTSNKKSSGRKNAPKSERKKRKELIDNYFADNDTVIAGDLADLLHDNCDYSNTDNPRSSAFSTIRDRVKNGAFVNLTKLDEEKVVTREDTIALAGYEPQQKLNFDFSKSQVDPEDMLIAW
jgi:hypothetical protein